MTKQYEVNGCNVFIEEYVYAQGCLPETGRGFHRDFKLKADSISDIVKKIIDFCGAKPGDEILDSCEEEGRIDVQVMECADGTPASDSDLDAWQEGKRRLWLADYSFKVELVERKTVPLFQDVSHETAYGATQKLSFAVRVF